MIGDWFVVAVHICILATIVIPIVMLTVDWLRSLRDD